ncbi:programmed cell death protein 2-like [Elysia marginata]|uniref:Programmed cell death protein 2-like n=1 Tax=Elysia marginata TaxID=1093978 RepID=A0AAV4G815_9GAST|nr:programmed cell death protein 2-like [Elysia marginata]
MFVLIGLIDQPIIRPERVGWDTNKVGGLPVWLAQSPDSPVISPPCRLCGASQTLVTQLYCPLGNSAFHRCLYVFACHKKCNNQTLGWRVFRSMKYDAAYDATSTGTKRTSEKKDGDFNSWAEDADDWGEDDGDDWGEGADDWGEEADDWGEEADDWRGDADECQVASSQSLICQNNSAMAAVSADESSVSIQSTSSAVKSMQHLADNFSAQMSITSNGNGLDASEEMDGGPASSLTNADTDEVLEEKMLVADSGRLDAIARILNTKEEQQGPSADNASTSRDVVLKPYYLEVFEEPVEEEQVSDHVLSLIKDYEKSEGHSLNSLLQERPKSGKGKPGPCESYEKSELRHGDRRFHKFLKRLQRCPQQCIR